MTCIYKYVCVCLHICRPFVSSESSLDRRQSSDRRGSVSSMTSQQSSHSSRRTKNDCDPHHPSSRSKRDSSRSRDFASQRIHDWTSPERHADRSVEMPHNVALGGGEADPAASSHRNGGLSHSHSHSLPPHAHHSTASHPHRGVEGEDWRVFPPAESYQGYGEEAQSRHRLELDERWVSSSTRLARLSVPFRSLVVVVEPFLDYLAFVEIECSLLH